MTNTLRSYGNYGINSFYPNLYNKLELKEHSKISKEYDNIIIKKINNLSNRNENAKKYKDDEVLFNHILQGEEFNIIQIDRYFNSNKLLESDKLFYYLVKDLNIINKDTLKKLCRIIKIISRDFLKSRDKDLLQKRCRAISYILSMTNSP